MTEFKLAVLGSDGQYNWDFGAREFYTEVEEVEEKVSFREALLREYNLRKTETEAETVRRTGRY